MRNSSGYPYQGAGNRRVLANLEDAKKTAKPPRLAAVPGQQSGRERPLYLDRQLA
jgi:hypothetical protein